MPSDMELVARLIDGNFPEAAYRLARLADTAPEWERKARAYESELKWLLTHARQLRVSLTEQEEGPLLATVTVGGSNYVLQDCPRLKELLAGKIPALEGR